MEGLADRDGFLISVSEDEETQFICVEPEDPDYPSLYIDFLADKIEAEVDAKQIPVERLPEEYRVQGRKKRDVRLQKKFTSANSSGQMISEKIFRK